MKKIILSLVILMSMTVVMNAQPETMRGFTAGGNTMDNSYGTFGQPFATIDVNNNHELSEGVAQMQVVYDTVYAVINYGDTYTDNGFNLPAQTKSHKDSIYLVNGGEYNYDLMRTLYLIVCPGPDSVKDRGDNAYNTVAVSGYCWTKENLRYETGNQMTYTTQQYPNVDVNKYGYLYTWADASNNGVQDNNGFVPGICPSAGWGWHLPNSEELVALFSNPASALRSVTDWQDCEENTNSTKFTAYPEGEFSSELNRFQGMGTETDWWAAKKDGDTFAHVIQLNNYCGTPLMTKRLVEDGLSVRCVMYNNWKALDEADAAMTNGD